MSKAHSRLEGISNCTKCHDLGNQVSDKKCLDCHKEIQNLVKQERGYHSSKEVKSKNCRDCHSEHFGRDFRLIRFNEKSFNHSLTTFKLTGKHTQTTCRKCHAAGKSYLGLSVDCASCHEDFHQGTLNRNCSTCHSTNSFQTAEYFDHNKANFKLLQAHTKVKCDQCHQLVTREGKRFQRFKGLSFTNCYPCHNDVHSNKFGKDCKSCHVVAGFKFINKMAFDHNKTKFPLVGRHTAVGCSSCHKSGISVKPSFQYCTDCHSDYHSGEFTIKDVTKDCSGCHNTQGFSPSLFTIEDHKKINFSLEGKHAAVDCRECHYKENKWTFRMNKNTCVDCHDNVHTNEISETIMNNGCGKCHSTKGWKNIEFDHSLTNFILTGKHSITDCNSCHYNKSSNSMHFSSTDSACESCHQDKHHGQFKINDITDCSRCHLTKDWIPESFDHNLTRFKLDGRHINVPCSKCHFIDKLKSGNHMTAFAILSEFITMYIIMAWIAVGET